MSKCFNQGRTLGWAALALVISTAVAHAQSSGCFSVSANAGWVNKSFTPVSGSFTVIFNATPSAAGAQMDTVMALSNTRQTNSSDFTGSAVLVRFNATGKIDARNGGVYPPSSLAYIAGISYRFRIDVNTSSHTYSAYVTPPSGVETPIALKYAFRTEQATLSTLSNFNAISDLAASSTICDFTLVPGQTGSGCNVAAAGANWTNTPFTSQSGTFTAVFNAAPSSSGDQMDTVMALSNAPQSSASDFTGSAALVRFNSFGTIDARNGSMYPVSSYQYSAGVPYRFRLVVNVPQHRYSVYVRPSGGTETAIAVNYAFRTEQSSISALSNFNAICDLSGSAVACNFMVLPGSRYDQTILSDLPVGLWDVAAAGLNEPDISGHGNTGTYKTYQASTVLPGAATMPNGDRAADFNGVNQYLTVPSNSSFSIPTTSNLTWEAWIRPDVLDFPKGGNGYVDFMGKCAEYSPTCEWESRMYNATINNQGRCDRLSAYAFNPTAGYGSGADWQPTCGLIQPGQWLHVVGEYTTLSQPATCPNTSMFPGSINIWVNGVKWDQSAHGDTGCMSQYGVTPVANTSPLNIGTMVAKEFLFKGAIGKVAIYNYLLSPAQINLHFTAMTGRQSTGSCGATCTF
jgi:concanavalin A-like lectin/glucanase superfamily protein